MLVKYWDKNGRGICNGVNYDGFNDLLAKHASHPLTHLLAQKFVDEKWLDLYVNIGKKGNVKVDKKKGVGAALSMCKEKQELSKFQTIVKTCK